MRNDGYAFVLRRVPFEMIKSGFKKEEYREITPYWLKRLLSEDRHEEPTYGEGLYALNQERAEMYCNDLPRLKKAVTSGKLRHHYNYGQFYLGYRKNRPHLEITISDITIGEGKPEWGAEPGKEYLVVKLKDNIIVLHE